MMKLTELIKQYEKTPACNSNKLEVLRRLARTEGRLDLTDDEIRFAIDNWNSKGTPETIQAYKTRSTGRYSFWGWARYNNIDLSASNVDIDLPPLPPKENENPYSIARLAQGWACDVINKGTKPSPDWHKLVRTCFEFGYVPKTDETTVPEVSELRDWVATEIKPHLDMFEHFEWERFDCSSSKRFLTPHERNTIRTALQQWTHDLDVDMAGFGDDTYEILLEQTDRQGGLSRLPELLSASVIPARNIHNVNCSAWDEVTEFLQWALVHRPDVTSLFPGDMLKDLDIVAEEPKEPIALTGIQATAVFNDLLPNAIEAAINSGILTPEQVNNPKEALANHKGPLTRHLLWSNCNPDGTPKVKVKVTYKVQRA